ncbi:MAG: PLP-dependent aminotransferase family protein [Chloroflexota bacterium]
MLDGQWTTDWSTKLAGRTLKMKRSVIRELLKLTQNPEIISFAGGLPAPEVFPVREFKESSNFILEECPQQALQYSSTEGFLPLRKYLAEKVGAYGVPAVPENILLTNGSQQALDLIGKVFISPGDTVLTEAPTYLGALQAWNAYETRFVSIPLDDDGMQVDKLEAVLQKEPVKFIYVLPNFQNPAGTTMPLERRIKLAEIAAKYDVFIVEDDPYGELRYEGEDVPPIISLHKENVIYLGTFSKTLAPGIRLGWIIAPEIIMDKLIQAKQGADLHTGTFVQMLAHDIASRGILKRHVKVIRAVYRERRDVMLQALEDYFPEGSSWTHPMGGLFLWARCPEGVDTELLVDKALAQNVAYVPGFAFFSDERGKSAMRLNFSCMPPDRIREGIARLGKVIADEVERLKS